MEMQKMRIQGIWRVLGGHWRILGRWHSVGEEKATWEARGTEVMELVTGWARGCIWRWGPVSQHTSCLHPFAKGFPAWSALTRATCFRSGRNPAAHSLSAWPGQPHCRAAAAGGQPKPADGGGPAVPEGGCIPAQLSGQQRLPADTPAHGNRP